MAGNSIVRRVAASAIVVLIAIGTADCGGPMSSQSEKVVDYFVVLSGGQRAVVAKSGLNGTVPKWIRPSSPGGMGLAIDGRSGYIAIGNAATSGDVELLNGAGRFVGDLTTLGSVTAMTVGSATGDLYTVSTDTVGRSYLSRIHIEPLKRLWTVALAYSARLLNNELNGGPDLFVIDSSAPGDVIGGIQELRSISQKTGVTTRLLRLPESAGGGSVLNRDTVLLSASGGVYKQSLVKSTLAPAEIEIPGGVATEVADGLAITSPSQVIVDGNFGLWDVNIKTNYVRGITRWNDHVPAESIARAGPANVLVLNSVSHMTTVSIVGVSSKSQKQLLSVSGVASGIAVGTNG